MNPLIHLAHATFTQLFYKAILTDGCIY